MKTWELSALAITIFTAKAVCDLLLISSKHPLDTYNLRYLAIESNVLNFWSVHLTYYWKNNFDQQQASASDEERLQVIKNTFMMLGIGVVVAAFILMKTWEELQVPNCTDMQPFLPKPN